MIFVQQIVGEQGYMDVILLIIQCQDLTFCRIAVWPPACFEEIFACSVFRQHFSTFRHSCDISGGYGIQVFVICIRSRNYAVLRDSCFEQALVC
ncbi:hypothetical protein D3C73_613410 [compost metagenome]